MSKFKWRDGGPEPKVAAETFGSVVESLAGDGALASVPPGAIVDAARKRNSPIHALFNWDNDDAAELYRKDQARALIGRLQIVRVQVSDGPTLSSRAFFSVRVGDKRGYVAQDKILSDRDLKKQVIESAQRDLEAYLAKYAGVMAFGTFMPRLQSVLDEMKADIDALTSEATKPKTTRRSQVASAPAQPAE